MSGFVYGDPPQAEACLADAPAEGRAGINL